MSKITLKPLREWVEKDKTKAYRDGSIRLYFSNLHVGTCEPILERERTEEDGEGELFMFHNMMSDIPLYESGHRTMEQIKEDVILSFKEFAAKFVQVDANNKNSSSTSGLTLDEKTDKEIHSPKVMTASSSRKLNSPLKKDGNGKR